MRGGAICAKAIAVALFVPCVAAAYYNLGSPSGFVNDFAGMLGVDQKASLEAKLVSFERDTGNEIAVVTIPSLDGDTIENFAVKLFEDWKIGKEKNDNGALVLIALDDRKMRIEVGYGLEGALTDAQSFWIIDTIMKPAFRAGNYYEGTDTAVDKIIAATKGEYVPESKPDKNTPSTFETLEIIASGIFFVAMWLASILARSKSWWAGGVLGGVIGMVLSIIYGFFFFGLGALLLFIPLGLLFDFVVSRGYERGKMRGHIPWWAGGRSGIGGHGNGGFGGFGGGSSGGGGASGGW
ncbi:MAG: hypothetical protein A3B25_02475 [Candidatus Ryanbacteria bacterium RIFCSPLOWO2_01_FULL_48_26]|uniref:TPM domain-containing protein n=1 Tax=Candidatus Ryanbacteria bacterium RIFCSPLOWO2_01_FULL_48_26 TaxID=1802126 RepID=A0A1G2GWG3_9BACT|nr:MAG: hypothetical protein A3B25_02475 [Candidatus Ryanbacteria bacterium RIFCSPLOWO2_01_FULL_48_26]